MQMISRRNFNAGLMRSVFTLSLMESLARQHLLGKNISPLIDNWLAEIEEDSRSMKKNGLRQIEWQQKIAGIFSRVELKDLLLAIDFERLRNKLKMVGAHEGIIETRPARLAGMPAELSFSAFIYGVKKDGAIPPHCHLNMTSMHMPIGGRVHGWHFDRISDEANHLVLKPTMNKPLSLGEVTTISDEKDNVHWFKPVSNVAYTFNIGVYEIDPQIKFSGRQFYLDAAHGEKIEGGNLRVKKINSQEAYKIYGSIAD